MSMSKKSEIFVSSLAKMFPLLAGAFEEHLKDNDRILPHILMADYCRVVLNADKNDTWIVSFLEELEKSFSLSSDDPVSNLIAVSFVENLPYTNEGHWIVDRLGHKLRKQYARFFSY